MGTRRRLPAMALAIGILAAGLVGVVTGGGEAAAATQHTLRLPAAAFAPKDWETKYRIYGGNIYNLSANHQLFSAPVLLQGSSATIHSVRVHYWDDGPEDICVWLYRYHMKSGVRKTMSSICTRNAVADYRTKIDTTIHPDTVGPDNATSLTVRLNPLSQGHLLHGVTIVYTSEP